MNRWRLNGVKSSNTFGNEETKKWKFHKKIILFFVNDAIGFSLSYHDSRILKTKIELIPQFATWHVAILETNSSTSCVAKASVS